MRALLGIGVRVQAVELTSAVRDQVVVLAAAAMGGLAVVAFWNLVQRLTQPAMTLFNSLLRVSFPAMSRLHAAGRNSGRVLPRLLGISSIVAGMLLVPLAGSAPALVPFLFGHRWSPVAAALPPMCLAILIGMPVVIGGHGYLWAIGDGKTLFARDC